MYKNIALQAVSLLVDSVGHFDEVEIKEYFNQFQFEECGLFDWAEELCGDPELQTDVYIFGILKGIKMAIEHHEFIFDEYSRMVCQEHTLGLPYPILVTAILIEANHQSFSPVEFTCEHCQMSSLNISIPAA